MSKLTDIGEIGNHYGCLTVKEDCGKFYWSIENWNGYYWEEISESLYKELLNHEESLKKTKE